MTSSLFTVRAADEGGGDKRRRAKGTVAGDVGGHCLTCSR